MRIATVVFILLHDGGRNSRALLTQLGKRAGMQFLASGHPIRPENMIPSAPLTIMRIGGPEGATYLPRLGDLSPNHRELKFGKWWEQDSIYSSGRGKHLISRKNLTFALRNKEGGAHFDQELSDENYLQMIHGPTWIVESGGDSKELRQVELASMRQIGWEVLETLRRHGISTNA